jgi:hypothetical protein
MRVTDPDIRFGQRAPSGRLDLAWCAISINVKSPEFRLFIPGRWQALYN